MGTEFKGKIMLLGFREIKCRWEVGEVERWERWKGKEMTRRERRESGEVGRWEGGRLLFFFKGGEHRVSPRFYLFVSAVNQGNEEDGSKIFLCARRDGKTLLRSSASC